MVKKDIIKLITFLQKNVISNNFLELKIKDPYCYYYLHRDFYFYKRSRNWDFLKKIFYYYDPIFEGIFYNYSHIYNLSGLYRLDFVKLIFGDNFYHTYKKFEKHSLFKKMKNYIEESKPENIFFDPDFKNIDLFHRYVLDLFFYIILFEDLKIFKNYKLSYSFRLKNKKDIDIMDALYLIRNIKIILYDTLYENKKIQKQYKYKNYFYLGIGLGSNSWEPNRRVRKITEIAGVIWSFTYRNDAVYINYNKWLSCSNVFRYLINIILKYINQKEYIKYSNEYYLENLKSNYNYFFKKEDDYNYFFENKV